MDKFTLKNGTVLYFMDDCVPSSVLWSYDRLAWFPMERSPGSWNPREYCIQWIRNTDLEKYLGKTAEDCIVAQEQVE